jgi:hypothetical protein
MVSRPRPAGTSSVWPFVRMGLTMLTIAQRFTPTSVPSV